MGNNFYRHGLDYESAALQYLLNHELKLVKRNFHSRFGEIDLIMRDKDTLVFIEVRKRNSGIDDALESITYHKQQKLVKAAQYYLLKCGFDTACRFDVVVMDSNDQIKWLKNVIIT